MGEANEGSIKGRGRKEMLPERGDPFLHDEHETPETSPDSSAPVFPKGKERAEAQADSSAHQAMDDPDAYYPSFGPERDGGMRAVGAPIEEDLRDDGLPPAPQATLFPTPSNDESIPGAFSEGTSPSAELPGAFESLSASQAIEDKINEGPLVSDMRIRSLHEKADLLRDRLESDIENPHLRRLLLRRIESIRGQPFSHREQFKDAERGLGEIEDRIRLQVKIQRWSKSLRTRLLIYELAMGIIMTGLLILLPFLFNRMGWDSLAGRMVGSLNDLLTMLNTLFWGGLGGIASALIGIWAHRTLDRSVDRQWAIWYVVNPWMGLVLGALVFFITRALILGIFPEVGSGFEMIWLLYLLGWLAGFRQDMIYDFVERILRSFESREKRKSR